MYHCEAGSQIVFHLNSGFMSHIPAARQHPLPIYGKGFLTLYLVNLFRPLLHP